MVTIWAYLLFQLRTKVLFERLSLWSMLDHSFHNVFWLYFLLGCWQIVATGKKTAAAGRTSISCGRANDWTRWTRKSTKAGSQWGRQAVNSQQPVGHFAAMQMPRRPPATLAGYRRFYALYACHTRANNERGTCWKDTCIIEQQQQQLSRQGSSPGWQGL